MIPKTKVALVTGAASGIGKAIATQLASDGFVVIIADINISSASITAAEIEKAGNVAVARHLDIGSKSSVQQIVQGIEEEFGLCDVLVNNAGIAKSSSFLQLPTDIWSLTLSINLSGPFFLSQKIAPLMIRRGWGRVINIASVAGIRAGQGRAAYGTSKTALIGLTRQMAIELAPYGITSNSIAPGPIETPLVNQFHSARTKELYKSLVPMLRYGHPGEVAAVASFLASDNASYVTGVNIPVDGGFIAAGLLDT